MKIIKLIFAMVFFLSCVKKESKREVEVICYLKKGEKLNIQINKQKLTLTSDSCAKQENGVSRYCYKKMYFKSDEKIATFKVRLSSYQTKFDSTYSTSETLKLIGVLEPSESNIDERVYFQTEEMLTRFNNSLKKKK
jgi:hypothetical protein